MDLSECHWAPESARGGIHQVYRSPRRALPQSSLGCACPGRKGTIRMYAKIFYRLLTRSCLGLAAAAGGCAPDAATDNVRWREDPFSPSVVMVGRLM